MTRVSPGTGSYVNVIGPVLQDDAFDNNKLFPVSGYASTATPAATSADGDNQLFWLTRNGALNIADAGGSLTVDIGTALPAGTNAIGKLAANSGVDIGDIDVTSIVPGVGATNLGKAEDAAHSSGDVGVMALGVANEGAAVFGTDGDYLPISLTTQGYLINAPKAQSFSLADGVSNSKNQPLSDGSGTIVMSVYPMNFNGTTWDRLRGDSTNGILVNLGANNDVSISGTVTVDGSGVTQPVSGTVTANLAAGNNNIGDVDVTSIAAGDNNIGNVDLASAIPAGTNTIGAVETDGTALSNGQVTIDTTVGGVEIVAASAGRQGVDITNQGSVDCYVGAGTVSSSNGFLLKAGESIWMPTDSQIKAITSSGSTTVGYLAYA